MQNGHAPVSGIRLEVAERLCLQESKNAGRSGNPAVYLTPPGGGAPQILPGSSLQAWRSSATSGQLIHACNGGPLVGIESYAAEAGTGPFFPKRQGVPPGKGIPPRGDWIPGRQLRRQVFPI
jgi:hypothetical protein